MTLSNCRVFKAASGLVITGLLIWAMLAGGTVVTAVGNWDGTPPVTTFGELRDAIQSAAEGETIHIGGDIEMTGAISINKSLTLSADSPVTLLAVSNRHFVTGGGEMTLTFDNVTLDGGGTGGGIITNSALLTLINPDITRCRALQGGGILYNGSLTVVGGSISGNDGGSAYGGYGGGLSGNGSGEKTLTITDGALISYNKAGAYGGGIYGGDNCRIVIEDSNIVNNEAGVSAWGLGGGICSHAMNVKGPGVITITNSRISDNRAVANGSQGGGIYLNYNYTMDLLDGAVISGNESGGMGAGVVVNAGATLNIYSGAEVTGNFSRGSCGGVMVYGEGGRAELNLFGGVVSGNRSTTNGGGIYGYMNSIITVKETEGDPPVISGNTSGKNGGGIYAYGDAVVIDVTGATINDNTATDDGGGIYIQKLENLTVNHSVMSGNKSRLGCRWTLGTGYSEQHFNADSETHWKNITETTFTTPYNNAYNNDDVVYAYNAPPPVLHTLRFVSGGGTMVAEQALAQGEKTAKPKDPVKDRYAFTGWYKEESLVSLWDFNTEVMPERDVTLYAGWEAVQNTVSFYNDFPGGTLIGKVTVAAPALSTADAGGPPAAPVREKRRFEGWFTVTNDVWTAFDVNAPVLNDVNVYARWINLYTAVFQPNGGTSIAPQADLEAGQKLSEPETPVREGYTFNGWFLDNGTFNEPWDFDGNTVNSDLTLYASWSEIITATEPPQTAAPSVTPIIDEPPEVTETAPADVETPRGNTASTPTPAPSEASVTVTAGPGETVAAVEPSPSPTQLLTEAEPAPPAETYYPVDNTQYPETSEAEGTDTQPYEPAFLEENQPPPSEASHMVVALSGASSGDIPVYMEMTTDGAPYGIWRDNGSEGLVLNALVPQADGTFIEFDAGGVPLGAWSQDDVGVWVFEPFTALSAFDIDMPATGELAASWVLTVSGLALGLTGMILRKRLKIFI